MTLVFTIFSAVLGAVVGSFLNACIHRMPRGVGLLNPRRSFCPSCNKVIPWYENIPILSWIFLRGRCAGCKAPIPVRYLIVELLTAGLFTASWQFFGYPQSIAYWAFLALLVAATFIDLEHFIIPDEITLGGTMLGVALCLAVPELMGTGSRLLAGGLSIAGAVVGFGVVFLVVEGGKLAFGKIRHRFPDGESFEWRRAGDEVEIRIGDETLVWQDVFSREKDKLSLFLDGPVSIDGCESKAARMDFFHNRALVDGEPLDLAKVEGISGRASMVVVPREAMGFGDVKFMACIGAFLGWQAVLFTLFTASIIGSIAGLAGLFLARDRAGVRIPFGPFLALGAVLWLFGGSDLMDWYFAALRDFRGGDF
jgi:leader peptidase (prepilin peptidase)/N-methyltransferase